jgi:hypothetical protein
LLAVALFVGALLGAAQAQAAGGQPSDATLAAMGLSELRVMSDSEGLNIRGLGYNGASAYGQSFAVVSSHGATAGSTNGYNAKGKYVAAGHNNSYAGVEVETGGGHGGGYCDPCSQPKPIKVKVKAFAGGSSSGYRK